MQFRHRQPGLHVSCRHRGGVSYSHFWKSKQKSCWTATDFFAGAPHEGLHDGSQFCQERGPEYAETVI